MRCFSRLRRNIPRISRALACVALAATLGACSNLEFPWVYRIDIEQGNIIKQDMVDKLKPGMTREQVEYVMGTPLIKDPFHHNRWDYVYTMRRGNSKHTTEKRLTVFFKDNKLVSMKGDFVPTSAKPATTQASAATAATDKTTRTD